MCMKLRIRLKRWRRLSRFGYVCRKYDLDLLFLILVFGFGIVFICEL
jgi:hypothetical protein